MTVLRRVRLWVLGKLAAYLSDPPPPPTIHCFRCGSSAAIPRDALEGGRSVMEWWAREHRCEAEPCTGIAAQWCPRCGECRCPREPMGHPVQHTADAVFVRLDLPDEPVPTLNDPRCPLHAPDSLHATEVEA